MLKKLDDFFLQGSWVFLWIYSIVAIIATIQEYYGGPKSFGGAEVYTHYNNYLIFKQSFFHLIDGKDLYSLYPSEHYDLYKYSPTFALLFGALAWLPNILGLLIWNLLNAVMLFFGVRMLKLNVNQKNIILLLSTVELFTSLQNSQSNGLITGLIVLAFGLMEKEKFLWACLCIALTVYIKLFGLFAFASCLLYKDRWKMTIYSAGIMILLAMLPVLVISFDQLAHSYSSWWTLLQSDYIPNPLSIIGVVKAWSGADLSKNMVLLIGLVLFLTPLLRTKFFDQFRFRIEFLSMILLWTVVFNHKAESPTFIIAVAGIAVWFISTGMENRWRNALLIFAMIFTSLSPTDLFPNFIQDNFFDPYSVKAIPCIVIYLTLLFELTFLPKQLTDQ